MALLTDFGECDLCKTRHGYLARKYKCKECGEIICERQAINGKQFNRPGNKVHCQWITGEKGKRSTVTRFCGVVEEYHHG